jgi:dTDP-4-dehydrorhamnose 3,5-epimerase
MLPGVRVQELKKNVDERGSFAEIFREDWRDFFGEDKIIQTNLSYSHPGVIRAWHRHNRGQVDYLVVLKGALKICAYDDTRASLTRGQLSEIVVSGERLEVVRVPGSYWHGTKTLGNESSLTVYLLNRLYNAKDPDEERRPWNDSTIVDPRVSKSYDWNKPAHK